MSTLEAFWQRLDNGPAVLFLGQEHLRIETGSDPLLAEIAEMFGGTHSGRRYDQLWRGAASQNQDAALAWISERCRRLSPPDWLKSTAGFAWNAVVSSAIDPIWSSPFRNEWRELAPIYDDEYFPRNPRSRRELHCTFLFGSLNQNDPKQRPPLSQFEYISRQQTARNLLQRIPDVLTPLGVLAIEAYDPENDWLSIADFYPVLNSLGQSQVHYFSVKDKQLEDPVLSELVRTGKVIPHVESLALALDRAKARGLIRPGGLSEWEGDAHRVTLQSQSIVVPRDIWDRVTNFGTLLDDNMLIPPQPISEEARYWEFRRFLFECGIRPLWSGFGRGLAFRREVEEQLRQATLARLRRSGSNNRPIIVHGQTGTGKTVALGSLAYAIATSRAYATIFIERKSQRPVQSDIDYCCQWLEDHGADAILIVWDGMVAASEYYELQGYLASRGRKVVVVGSSYKLKETAEHLVEVPDQLTKTEAEAFSAFLESLGIEITERHRDALESRDPSYLVALYRLLPPARPHIRTGVVQELERLESDLVASINEPVAGEQLFPTLAMAMLSAGVIDRSKLEELFQPTTSVISFSEVSDLVDVVTVPGKFGLSLPIELLARTVGASDFANLAQVLRSFDLIHAYEDASGRILVGPRHRLEASLIVQARIGTVQSEAAIVRRIIQSMRPSVWPDENDEMEFVITLLQEVGPRGDERPRFAATFQDLATALSWVRENRNVRNPRLMLQEAYLLREWIASESRRGARPKETREILDDTKAILEEAMEMLGDARRHRRLRTIIATELSSTFGTATIDSINHMPQASVQIAQNFQRLLDSIKSARRLDLGAYNPIDILAWTTFALAGSGTVDDVTRTEAIIDVIDALDTVDEDLLESHNVERLGVRRFEAFNLLGQDDMSDAAFQDLLAIGSAAGFYIRALNISGIRATVTNKRELDRERTEKAWEYLEEHRKQLDHDPRCLNLLFDYWWFHKTGQRLFETDRVALPFSEHDWSYVLQLIGDLRRVGSFRDLTLSLLEAIGMFHANQVSQALDLFHEVENTSDVLRGRRRIQRVVLASEPDGQPRVFHGNVRWVHQEGRRGEVYVDEFGKGIPFIPIDFGRPNIRRGESLGAFHIAFNFIGPIAEPRTR